LQRNKGKYIVENVFENLPHFYVTADLYRPNHAANRADWSCSGTETRKAGPATAGREACHERMKGFVALAYNPVAPACWTNPYRVIPGLSAIPSKAF
jgi:hypothetical protein